MKLILQERGMGLPYGENFIMHIHCVQKKTTTHIFFYISMIDV